MEKQVQDAKLMSENKEQIERLNQITKAALNTQNQEMGIQMTQGSKHDQENQMTQNSRHDQ